MPSPAPGPAATPKIVRIALWVNLCLLLVAMVAPRAMGGNNAGMAEAAGAALFFVVPMTLILVIGSAAAIRAYILARREGRSVRWTAFLPLSPFLLGIAGTLFLVYQQ